MTRRNLIRKMLVTTTLSVVLMMGCGNSKQTSDLTESSTEVSALENSTMNNSEVLSTNESEASDNSNAKEDVSVATSSDKSNSTSIVNEKEEEKPLEIQERGYTMHLSGNDVCVDYCAKLYNPNTTIAFRFPVVQVYIENSTGTILATSDITGSYVMPQDSVVLSNILMISADAEVDDGTKIHYTITSYDTVPAATLGVPKSTDFEISNISEQRTDNNMAVTGKITNNYEKDIDSVSLTALFKKDGEVVGVASTFLRDLIAGRATVFEIDGYGDTPEHDEIEVSAQYW